MYIKHVNSLEQSKKECFIVISSWYNDIKYSISQWMSLDIAVYSVLKLTWQYVNNIFSLFFDKIVIYVQLTCQFFRIFMTHKLDDKQG